MELRYCSNKKRKYKHLNEHERCKIEALISIKKSVSEIVVILRRDASTIYRELKRGAVLRLQSDLTEKEQYRAKVGQDYYVRQGKNKSVC